jgi:hypothetical protein
LCSQAAALRAVCAAAGLHSCLVCRVLMRQLRPMPALLLPLHLFIVGE